MKWIKIAAIILAVPVLLFAAFLAWATIGDYRPEEKTAPGVSGTGIDAGPDDSVFSIITWNIGYFGLGKECDFFYDGGKMTRPAKTDYERYSASALNYLKDNKKTDFYFFQEVDFDSKRSYSDDQLARLQAVFPGMESVSAINYKVAFVPVPLSHPLGKVNSGLVSFMKYRPVENTRYSFPTGYSWPVGLFQLDRCFLLSRIALPFGKELILINTHNEAFDDGSQRTKQLAVLRELMLAEYGKGNYVVVGGDWNQNPVGYTIERFTNDDLRRRIEPAIEPDFLPAGWQWVFDPALPTNRDVIAPYEHGKTLTTIIDFFVVSPNVEVLEIKTDDLGFEWCDHQPVEMTFRLGL